MACAILAGGLLAGCGAASGPAPRLGAQPVAGTAGVRAGASHAPGAGSGIPRSLLAEARPIGRGPRFHPPPGGAPTGACRRSLGPRAAVHVEVFAADRVVIVPAGIGVGAPWRATVGRITAARCYGTLVTLEPTGVVLVARGGRLRLADLFRAWRQPLSSLRVASFATPASRPTRVFVDGRRWMGAPGSVPLSSHSEIVVEIGPRVPPHRSFAFPPGPP